MKTIYDHNDSKIALKFGPNDIKSGLSFFSEETDFLQVGSWRYEHGKKLLAHIHNTAHREISRTQEFIYVTKGSLKAFLYDEDKRLIEEITVNTNEGLILFAGGHGYQILDDDTIILEIKNGPYVGAELDRKRIESE